MSKSLISNLLKTLLFGVIWTVIGFVIATILVKSKNYDLRDVIFIEGIIIIVISILSSIGGNPSGLLSLQGLSNPTAALHANLEITKRERERNPMKQTLTFAVSSVSLIFGGLLLILLNFII